VGLGFAAPHRADSTQAQTSSLQTESKQLVVPSSLIPSQREMPW